MLSRLEDLYLNILRVFILTAASLALIAAIAASLAAVPSLAQKIGITGGQSLGTDLGSFIKEERLQNGNSDSPSADTARNGIDTALQTAAQNVHDYLGERSDLLPRYWENLMVGYSAQMPEAEQAGYADNALDLSNELKRSTGAPLSEQRVERLLNWHGERYLSSIQEKALDEAQANAQFLLRAGLALSALIAFAFVVFIFIFVRVERNLRNVGGQLSADDGAKKGERPNA